MRVLLDNLRASVTCTSLTVFAHIRILVTFTQLFVDLVITRAKSKEG